MILALLLPLPALAQTVVEPKLVPDVSQRNINIQSRFTGAELLLFGAIIYPRGVAPEGQVDVAVVLRGPTRPIILREKQKVAGIGSMPRVSIFARPRPITPSLLLARSTRLSMHGPRRFTNWG